MGLRFGDRRRVRGGVPGGARHLQLRREQHVRDPDHREGAGTLTGNVDGGGGITGFNSVADYPAVTEYLLKNGYTKEDVAKIWGGNVLRVLRETEAYVKSQKPAA